MTTNQQDNWEVRYFEGGRELMRALGQQLVVGESFAFLGPHWGSVPLIASILRTAGVHKASPVLFPLWGQGELELPGAKLRQRPLKQRGLCALWTDRQVYREYRDPVKVMMSDPFRPQTQVSVSLLHEGRPFGEQNLFLDEFGICLIELQDLPIGRYKLQTDEGLASTEFTVAQARLQTMSAEWVQQYTQPGQNNQEHLVFVLQCSSFGAPVQGSVAIQLLDESGDTPKPIAHSVFRADGAGRVAGDLPFQGTGPFSLEIHSSSDQTRWCSIPVGEGKQEHARPQRSVLCPLGTMRTWHWSGEGGLLGFEIETLDAWQQTPVALIDVVGQQAVLRAEEPIDTAMIQVIDPVTGQIALHEWEQLSQGQQIELNIPRPGGVIAIGGWVHGDPWEGWSLALPSTSTSLGLNILPRNHRSEPLSIELSTQLPHAVPVYVVIREEEEVPPRPWGPSGAFQDALRGIAGQMHVGQPNKELWREALQQEAPTQRQNHISRALPTSRPSIPPPSTPHPSMAKPPAGPGIPPPSTPPPGQEHPFPAQMIQPPPPQEPTWERPPPQQEHFAKTLYCGILTLEQRQVLTVDLPDESTQVEVEAVAIAGPTWAYARAESNQGDTLFAELLLPRSCHPGDAITGEAVLASQQGPIQVAIWCNQQPISLYQHNEPIPHHALLQDDVIQIEFAVQPGHYIMQVCAADGTELDRLEAHVAQWGEQVSEGWGLHMLAPGEGIQAHPPEMDVELLPSMALPIQHVAKNILERSPGHCEVEAARVCAAAYAIHFAENHHEQSASYNQLVQGLERLEAVRVPGMGLRLYPGGPHQPKWAMEAVYHLWELSWLTLPDPNATPEWHWRILELADELARNYNLPPVPTRINSCRDAYRVFRAESSATRQEEAIWEADKRITQSPDGLHIDTDDPILKRKESAYAAMVLLASGKEELRQKGLHVANWTLRQWSAEESGFSSQEGIALLSLMGLIQQWSSPPHPGHAIVDGQGVDVQQLQQPQPAHQLQSEHGLLAARLRYPRMVEPLPRFRRPVSWRFSMHRPGAAGQPINQSEVGERLQLTIQLPQPGQIGDLIAFHLPPCLCWIDGERDETYFAVDVTEQQTITLPLVAISTTHTPEGEIGAQHWGIRLFNMYDGTRGNNALDQSITVFPQGHRRKEQGVFRRWRKIFG